MKQLRELLKKTHKLEENLLFDQEKDFGPRFRKALGYYTELGSSFAAIIIITITSLIELNIRLFFIFLSIYLFQLVIVEIIKAIFSRTRPNSQQHRSIIGIKTTKGSFPSGHASNIFTLAFLFTNYYSLNLPLTIVLYAIAGSIALTRILLGKHYLFDVFVGGILGIVLSYSASLIIINLLTQLNT